MPDRARSTEEIIHESVAEFLEERATHHDRMVNVVGKPLKDDHRELAEAYRTRLAALDTPQEPEVGKRVKEIEDRLNLETFPEERDLLGHLVQVRETVDAVLEYFGLEVDPKATDAADHVVLREVDDA